MQRLRFDVRAHALPLGIGSASAALGTWLRHGFVGDSRDLPVGAH
jgi:hypothetical protein